MNLFRQSEMAAMSPPVAYCSRFCKCRQTEVHVERENHEETTPRPGTLTFGELSYVRPPTKSLKDVNLFRLERLAIPKVWKASYWLSPSENVDILCH